MSRFRSALALLGPFVLLASSSGCEMGTSPVFPHGQQLADAVSVSTSFRARSTSMKQRAADQKRIQLATDGDRALEYAKVR